MSVVKPGEVIHEIRTDMGWSGSELARRAGISPAHLSKLEKGHEQLRYPTLVKIAKALRIKPCVFLMDRKDRDAFDNVVGVRWW